MEITVLSRRIWVWAAMAVFVLGCDSGIDYSMVTPAPSSQSTPSAAIEGSTQTQPTSKTTWDDLAKTGDRIKGAIPNPFLTAEEKERLKKGGTTAPPPPVTVVGGGLAAVFKAESDEDTFAVFNGRIVRPGDQIGDKRVLAIEDGELRLVGPDETVYIYRLADPAS